MTKHYRTSDFEKAIPNSGGIISTIAKRVGCDWSTARRAIEKSPKLTEMFENEREAILDMAESTIFMSIKNGDTQDAKWLLSRLGKNRGYSERQEITGRDGEPVEVLVYLPDNQRDGGAG